MPQFDAYPNPEPGQCEIWPYIVDLQSDLLSDLSTRVAVPLIPISSGEKLDRLTPVVRIGDAWFSASVHELSSVPAKLVSGSPAASLIEYRDQFIAALDFLITGI